MPKVIGAKGDGIARSHGNLITGFYSLDHAFNPRGDRLGIPYGTIWEIYGAPSTAKSTTAYSLASILAAHFDTGWILVDTEDAFTPEYVSTIGENHGMSENNSIALAKGKYHEDRLEDIYQQMHDEVVTVGVIDSLGMVMSRAEVDGKLGEANMGKRAFTVNGWVKKFFMLKSINFGYLPPESTVFMVNHQQPALTYRGMVRPGGTGKDYGAGVRIHLQNDTDFKGLTDGSMLIHGEVKKLRWEGGGKGNRFQFVSKVGYGMHRGLSAILDLRKMKAIKIIKGVISAGNEKMPYRFSHYLKTENEQDFEVFYELLEKIETEGVTTTGDDEDGD